MTEHSRSDRTKIEEIHDLYYTKLQNFCRRNGWDESLANRTLEIVWQRDPEEVRPAFLFKIAWRLGVRDSDRNRHMSTSLDAIVEPRDSAPTPEQQATLQDSAAFVRSRFHVPELFERRMVNGESYEEICEELGLPQSKEQKELLHSQLWRQRNRLAKQVFDSGHSHETLSGGGSPASIAGILYTQDATTTLVVAPRTKLRAGHLEVILRGNGHDFPARSTAMLEITDSDGRPWLSEPFDLIKELADGQSIRLNGQPGFEIADQEPEIHGLHVLQVEDDRAE